ncbi:MAG: flagellar hook-basal body complex protein FliE [Pseudolabrys sp.]
MASPLAAASAYANIARLAIDPTQALANAAGAGAPKDAGDTSFASMVKDAVGGVIEAGRKSDAQTRSMANGKSNMVDVVTAVAETEVAVDAVVAVRDKVIAAYEEIMKMPI